MSSSGIILIVEDNEDDVFALLRTLKKIGITEGLYVVRDGQQAVNYLAGVGTYSDRTSFPLPSRVLLDLKLPYLNGFEVLDWIRKQPQFRALQVALLTGSDEARDHAQATSLGISHYLVKPASPEDLDSLFKAP